MLKAVLFISLFLLFILIILSVSSCNKRRFMHKTSFKRLDYDHQEMYDALDKFHKLCLKHWDEEKHIYRKGRRRVPRNHPVNVDEQWEKHEEQHRLFIERIEHMKEDLVNHIVDYDIPHFHFGHD